MRRKEILREAKRCFGAVATESTPRDCYLDCIDLGAYIRLSGWTNVLNAISIPLWQLIYHDCVLNYAGIGTSGVRGAEYRAYQALYTLLPTNFDSHNLRISKELRSTCLAEMLSHEFLDGNRQKTTFSDGTSVIADFSTGNWEILRS